MSVWRKAFCAVAGSALLLQIAPAFSREKYSNKALESIKPSHPDYEIALYACTMYGTWAHMNKQKLRGQKLSFGSIYAGTEKDLMDANDVLIEGGIVQKERNEDIQKWFEFIRESKDDAASDICRDKLQKFPLIMES